MNASKTRFVAFFVLFGFVFQFLSNSLLGSEVRLFPARHESFLGMGSPVAWKNAASILLLPIKAVLLGPLLPIAELPDLPPPFLIIAFGVYWAILALLVYHVLGRLKRTWSKTEPSGRRN